MIETVPFINDINITERTILYSDKILNLKENGILLCITTINNISPYMLENKIEEIFNTHKDINYYMIQYNEKDKLLIFYTYEPLISNNKIIIKQKSLKDDRLYNYYEEIQKEFENLNIIESMIPLKNENTVSLKDIINTYNIIKQKYQEQITKVIDKFNNILAKREKKEPKYCKIDLNSEKNEIEYSYELWDEYSDSASYTIIIKMINNKLFFSEFEKSFNGLKTEEYYQKNKIIENYETIKALLTDILKYKEFRKKNKQIIQSINSNILLKLDTYSGIFKLYYKVNKSKFSLTINEKEEKIHSESLELYGYLLENLDNIKELLFFRKIDCPIWMQEYWEMETVVKKLSDEDETTYEESQIETEKVYIRKSFWPLKKNKRFFVE